MVQRNGSTIIASSWVRGESQHSSRWLSPHFRFLLDTSVKLDEANSWILGIGTTHVCQSLFEIFSLPIPPHLVYKAMMHHKERITRRRDRISILCIKKISQAARGM